MTIAILSRSPASQLPPPPKLDLTDTVSVFLDFDGTLVEIADHPQNVVVAAALPQILTRLSERLEGRLAIVSGRALAALDAFLGPIPVAMAGSHGGEFRPAGASEARALAAPLPASVLEALRTFAQDNGSLVFEAKPFSAAVHYRDRPGVGDALVGFAGQLADGSGLLMKHGKMVVELTMPGSDKGNAVTEFMKMAPFEGTRPLFLGDDVTDEDAFAAVRGYDGGGVLVGPPRRTQALWRLDGVAAVHEWLEQPA